MTNVDSICYSEKSSRAPSSGSIIGKCSSRWPFCPIKSKQDCGTSAWNENITDGSLEQNKGHFHLSVLLALCKLILDRAEARAPELQSRQWDDSWPWSKSFGGAVESARQASYRQLKIKALHIWRLSNEHVHRFCSSSCRDPELMLAAVGWYRVKPFD